MSWRFVITGILISGAAMVLLSNCGSHNYRRLIENPCAGGNEYVTVKPVEKPRARWKERHNKVLERIKQGNVDMVFIGNSLTQRWESTGITIWNEYYGSRNAVNMGFDGDLTQNVLWRLDNGEIDGIAPKIAVVMIGSNHVNKYTIEEISAGIKAVCCRIRTKLPKTKILLLAILPRGDASAAAAYRLNKSSLEASRIADDRMIFYLNISEKFLDTDGNVSKDMMTGDGVHLRLEGYKTLAEEMEPVISKLMKKN